jgi:hypothetical protein
MTLRAALVLSVLWAGACGYGVPVSPLAAAARAGDVAEIDRLLDAGADVNAGSGVNDWPPIVHAIHKKQLVALGHLLDRGARLDEQVLAGPSTLPEARATRRTFGPFWRRTVARPRSPACPERFLSGRPCGEGRRLFSRPESVRWRVRRDTVGCAAVSTSGRVAVYLRTCHRGLLFIAALRTRFRTLFFCLHCIVVFACRRVLYRAGAAGVPSIPWWRPCGSRR